MVKPSTMIELNERILIAQLFCKLYHYVIPSKLGMDLVILVTYTSFHNSVHILPIYHDLLTFLSE